MTTDEVRRVRYTQVIKDPFPEHTAYQRLEQSLGLLGRKFFRFLHETTPAPEPISIWRAYKMGYDQAYEEMLAAADLVSTTRNVTDVLKEQIQAEDEARLDDLAARTCYHTSPGLICQRCFERNEKAQDDTKETK